MGRARFSEAMQRAIMGLCVAWKPLIAPQAMVMHRAGKMSSLNVSGCVSLPRLPKLSQISGRVGNFTSSTIVSDTAMKMRATANTGYILPMTLSIGSIVAMM